MSEMLDEALAASDNNQFITVRIAGQLFGLPISAVHEVFVPEHVTRVPLAPPEVEGVLNLRGRIVTTIDLRKMLGLAAAAESIEQTAIGIEHKGESFGLLVDHVGEVLSLDQALREPCPPNIDPRWAEIVSGVYRVTGELMLILDVERALTGVTAALAA